MSSPLEGLGPPTRKSGLRYISATNLLIISFLTLLKYLQNFRCHDNLKTTTATTTKAYIRNLRCAHSYACDTKDFFFSFIRRTRYCVHFPETVAKGERVRPTAGTGDRTSSRSIPRLESKPLQGASTHSLWCVSSCQVFVLPVFPLTLSRRGKTEEEEEGGKETRKKERKKEKRKKG